jgi:hypothetical protein
VNVVRAALGAAVDCGFRSRLGSGFFHDLSLIRFGHARFPTALGFPTLCAVSRRRDLVPVFKPLLFQVKQLQGVPAVRRSKSRDRANRRAATTDPLHCIRCQLS